MRIKEKQRKYIVAESLRRRAKGKYRTAFKYKDSEEKIPKDKVEKILKRYKTTVNGECRGTECNVEVPHLAYLSKHMWLQAL